MNILGKVMNNNFLKNKNQSIQHNRNFKRCFVAVGLPFAVMACCHSYANSTPVAVEKNSPVPKTITINKAVSNAKKNQPMKTKKYLISIKNMSVSLNLLAMENQVLKQKVELANSVLDLKKAGVENATELTNLKMFKGTQIFSRKKIIKIDMIYKSDNHLECVLDINGTRFNASQGMWIDHSRYQVTKITSIAVVLKNKITHKKTTLSITDQMELV